MNEILQSLKSDLLDRRLLPILLLLGVALVGAVAYTVLAGGGSSANPGGAQASAAAAPRSSQGSVLAVQQAPADPHAAVAETTEGARFQHKVGSHDPFTQLSSPKAQSAKSEASSKSPSSSSSSSSSSTSSSTTPTGSSGSTGGSGGGGTTPTQPAHRKPKVVHRSVAVVSVLFGLAPTIPGQLSQLTPYAAVKRLEPLPSSGDPLIVFEGISADKRSAVFALVREAILKGGATCLPSTTQCEAIDLPIGQTEELGYLESDGQTVTYELALTAIAWHEETYATAARLDRANHAGQALLRSLAPSVQSDLRFSSAKGVLVYTAPRAG